MHEVPPIELATLPIWRRILFCALLPLGMLIGAIAWYYQTYDPFRNFRSTPGWGVTAADLVIPLIVVGVLSVVFVPLLVLAVARCVFKPWKHWWSALLGGIGATGIGLSLGVLVFLIIRALS